MTNCWVPYKEINFYLPSGIISHCCKHVPIMCEKIESHAHGKSILNNLKLRQIKQSLSSGEQNPICTECWKSEARGEKSWRLTEGGFPKENVQQLSISQSQYSQVALYFDNTCDSACAYCGPQLSSKWESELKQAEPLNLAFKFPYKTYPKDPAVYQTRIARILEFLEELGASESQHQKFMHLTFLGGEPLLSPEMKNGSFLKYIESIYRHKNKNEDFQLMLTFHTNAGTPQVLLDRFFKDIETTKQTYKGLKVKIIFSFDTIGTAHEFIRYGSQWSTVDANIRKYCESPLIDQVGFSPTLSIFNITTLESLFIYMAELSDKYKFLINTCLGTTYFPFYLNPYELTPNYAPYVKNAILAYEKNKHFFNKDSQEIISPTLEKLYHKISGNSAPSKQIIEALDDHLKYVKTMRNTDVSDYVPNFDFHRTQAKSIFL